MKISNEAMEVILNVFADLPEQQGKLAFVLAYNKQKISDASKTYHDMKSNLIQKYGKPAEKEGTYYINQKEDPEKFNLFMKEMGDTPNVEIDVDILKVTPEELYSGTLTTSQMTNLMWMVNKEEGEKE